ncbi:hypothetical protein ET475_11925 [Microbacterium protaetiae]|uniref:Uncharacterized protein n=1 Tax=Microbacterium protaetiae TaxID=2509458 RepID=A0A4P6EEL6_9MICO|nr:hypothetical protein [Microbacterium protaetiae]QAY60624.1 hypothetical protein ET475_11925 [Microbacterium protaetiae]
MIALRNRDRGPVAGHSESNNDAVAVCRTHALGSPGDDILPLRMGKQIALQIVEDKNVFPTLPCT